MSFQGYLNTIQQKTGRDAAMLRTWADGKGFCVGGILKPGLQAGAVVTAAKEELGLGHGHAMAIVALLKGIKTESEAEMPVDLNAAIEITAYATVPEMARGRVKDMRVRWALEEIGVPYRTRLLGGVGGEKSPEHLADQPFGQVPVYKEAGLTLFESGAILICIGEKDERLLPRDSDAKARAIGWAFAALNSVEPFMQTLFFMTHFADGKDWQGEAKSLVQPFAEMRLAQLAGTLGDNDLLEDRFTIGDLLMIDVLRAGTPPQLIAPHPNLVSHVERGTSRPAFKAALAAQLADLEPLIEKGADQ